MKILRKDSRRVLVLVAVGLGVLLSSWILIYSLVSQWFEQSFNAPPDPESVQTEYAAKLPFNLPGKDVIFFTQGAWAGDYTPMIGICSSLQECAFGEFTMNMFDKKRPIQVSVFGDKFIQLEQDDRVETMNLNTITLISRDNEIAGEMKHVGCLHRPSGSSRWTFGQDNCEQ